MHLRVVRHAPPCVEFSGYASRSREPEVIKGTLQFLGDGLRGFYCTLSNSAPVTIYVGDLVLVGPAAH